MTVPSTPARYRIFNIYIGESANPACTYFVGSTACGVPVDTILFTDFRPGESHQYALFRVPLSLEQMKAIDGWPRAHRGGGLQFPGSIDDALR